MVLLVYPLQVARLAARQGIKRRASWERAIFTVLANDLQAAGITGTVLLQATIGTDGMVTWIGGFRVSKMTAPLSEKVTKSARHSIEYVFQAVKSPFTCPPSIGLAPVLVQRVLERRRPELAELERDVAQRVTDAEHVGGRCARRALGGGQPGR